MEHTNAERCYQLPLVCRITAESGNVTLNSTCLDILIKEYGCERRSPSTTEIPTLFENDFNAKLWLFVLLLIIAIFSFCANAFVCLIYALCKEVRAAKHYFILNLAVADILIATIAIPFFLASNFYKARVTICQIGSVFDVLCCTLSIINFAAISLERFIAIKYPLHYHSIVSSKRCICAVLVVWFYAVLTAISAFIPNGELHLKHCVFFSGLYIATVTFTSFLLPLIAMIFTYGWIFKVAKYQARQIHSIGRTGGSITVKKEFKAAKTLTLIIGVYVLCWFPFFIYICLTGVFKVSKASSLGLFYAVQIIRYFNSLANPFIYVGISRDFRRKAFKLLKSWTSSRTDDIEVSNRSCVTTTTGTPPQVSSKKLNTACEDSALHDMAEKHD